MLATIAHLFALRFTCEILGARHLLFVVSTATLLLCAHQALQARKLFKNLNNFYSWCCLPSYKLHDGSVAYRYVCHRTKAFDRCLHKFPPPRCNYRPCSACELQLDKTKLDYFIYLHSSHRDSSVRPADTRLRRRALHGRLFHTCADHMQSLRHKSKTESMAFNFWDQFS